MARGRKAKAECSKCETIMVIGETIDESTVRMICTNCDFTKEILLEKVPDVCRKKVVDAAIPDEILCTAAADVESREIKTPMEIEVTP